MPINMNDPRILAETDPPTIKAIGAGLRSRYGTGADSVGIGGNSSHNSGFHRSENWIRNSPDSRDSSSDYSIQGSLNVSADRNARCALDFTPGVWGSAENRRRMIELTTRVHNAALAHDPRLANVFEFAGTLDGVHVVTFRCSDGAARSPFDSSHLDHMHASFYRSRALNNHDGLTAVLLGGDDMAGERADAILDSWAWGIDHFTDPITGANRPLGPVQWEIARGAKEAESKAREVALANVVASLVETVNHLATGGTSLDTAAVMAKIDEAANRAFTAAQVAQVDAAAFAAAQRAEDS